jgi:S1-C subfamily serine protease
MRRVIHITGRAICVLMAVAIGWSPISANKDLGAFELFKGRNKEARTEAKYPKSFADLARRMKPSVINIRSTKLIKHPGRGFWGPFGPRNPFRDFFGDEFFNSSNKTRPGNSPRTASARDLSSMNRDIS